MNERTKILLRGRAITGPEKPKRNKANERPEEKENRERTDKIFRFYFYISEREVDTGPIFLYLVAIVGYIPGLIGYTVYYIMKNMYLFVRGVKIQVLVKGTEEEKKK